MIRAAIYTRVSTEEQAMHGLSIDTQKESLLEYVKQNGMNLVGVYSDEGISARKRFTKRPALLRLLDDVKADKIDLILFIKLDRWTRNVRDYYTIQDVLDAHHVAWRATLEDYETQTPDGQLKVNIMLSVAQNEADRTGQRVKFIIEAKRAKAESSNGRAPLGYKVVNAKYVVDEKMRDAAVDMFAEYIRTRSVCAVMRFMGDKYNLHSHYNLFSRALRNRMYIGEIYGHPNAVEALVSEADFDLVQSIMESRAQRCARKEPNKVYLFSGMLFCGECGSRMSSNVCKGKYIYYRCQRRSLDSRKCDHFKRINEQVLERSLRDSILARLDEYNAAVMEEQKNIKTVPVDAIKAKMTKLKDLYLNDMIQREDYFTEYTALSEELKRAEEIKPPQVIELAPVRDALAEYDSMTTEQKKEFWNRTVKKINAYNDGRFDVILC